MPTKIHEHAPRRHFLTRVSREDRARRTEVDKYVSVSMEYHVAIDDGTIMEDPLRTLGGVSETRQNKYPLHVIYIRLLFHRSSAKGLLPVWSEREVLNR